MLFQEAHNYRTKVLTSLYKSMKESSRVELFEYMELDGPGYNPIKSQEDYNRRESIVLEAIHNPDWSIEFNETRDSLFDPIWQYNDGKIHADRELLTLCFMFSLAIMCYEEESYSSDDVVSFLDFIPSIDDRHNKECANLFRMLSKSLAGEEPYQIENTVNSSFYELLARATCSSVYDDQIDADTLELLLSEAVCGNVQTDCIDSEDWKPLCDAFTARIQTS